MNNQMSGADATFLRTRQSPLVGRDTELEILYERLDEVEQSISQGYQPRTSLPFDTQKRPQCLFLMGVSGIGKTRLAEEMARQAIRRGWQVIWGRAYQQECDIPYHIWTEALRKAIAESPFLQDMVTSSFTTTSRIEGEQDQAHLNWQPLLKLLPDLASLVPEVLSDPLHLSPEQEQLRLHEAVRDLLCVVGAASPLLIVLDDVQWADASSHDLLGYLARHATGQPLLFAITCRDTELPLQPPHPLRLLMAHMLRERSGRVLQVAPLSESEIGLLVSHLPTERVLRIQAQAAGNPFFAEELALSTLPTLPTTITAALEHHIQKLSSACQHLLRGAAVLGGSFTFPILYAMEAGARPMAEDEVLELLEEALGAGVLSEEEQGREALYHFWHPLLASYLYEHTSAMRRARLHQRAAQALQEVYTGREDEVAALITHHLLQGDAPVKEISRYAQRAAERAYALSAYAEAAKYYQLTLEHFTHTSQDHAHHAYLLECLGECVRFQGKYQQARAFYEQALGEREKPTSADNLSTEEALIQALLWCEIGVTWYDQEETVKARRCYQHGEALLEVANVTTGGAWANLRLEQSYSYWREGNYIEARHRVLEALKFFEEDGANANSHLPTWCSMRASQALLGNSVNLGRIYTLLGMIEGTSGRISESLRYQYQALPLFEQHGQVRELAILLCNMGDAHLRRAEFSQARTVLRRSLKLTERVGDSTLLSFLHGNLGILAARLGDLNEARDTLSRSIVLAEQTDDTSSISQMRVYLANVLQAQGEFQEASIHLCRAFVISRKARLAPYMAMILRALGDLRLTQALAIPNDTRQRTRLLRQAASSLTRVLALAGIEHETRGEARLLLAEVFLLLNCYPEAQEQAKLALTDSELYELTWLRGHTQRLYGHMEAYQQRTSAASAYYDQALQTFHQQGMRLEAGRTLLSHAQMLLQGSDTKSQQRGLQDLQSAQRIFQECSASFDAHRANLLLENQQLPPPSL